MVIGNKTLEINCRYLKDSDFSELHATFLDAFSDYFISFQLSEEQLKNHIALNSVDLSRSVGAFSEDKMVGFTLNGFGEWNDKKTVYDAGTGVIPAFRHQGIGRRIFDFMTPQFRAAGYEQMLLEVISENVNAIRLYEKLGFQKTRRLLYFERRAPFDFEPQTAFEMREISNPDWHLFEKFSDGQTSWQNSATAMRQTPRKVILGAFAGDECVGCGIFFPKTGSIAQLAVAREHRRKGAASAVLAEMQTRIGKDKNLKASNVDETIESAVAFFKKRGFSETLSQWEMIKIL